MKTKTFKAWIKKLLRIPEELLDVAKLELFEMREGGFEMTARYQRLQAVIVKAEVRS